MGIVCNLLLFAGKLVAGTLAGAVSITAEAVNNLSDASSSLVTLLGFRLAARPADEEHPYGHARLEFLSGLGVAVLILVSGVELGKTEPFFKRMKNSVNILLPLILTSLNRIDTISNAMELRGFGKQVKRIWYTRRPFARRDFIALIVGVVLLLISLTVTIRFGRFYNPFV